MTSKAGESAGVPAAGSGGRSVPRPRRTTQVLSAGVAAAFFTFCLLLQYFSGAWSASFDAYPDEPAHFVGAVMVREWLVSGRWFPPFEFAKNYYAHYPFFAVGFWPPLFSIVTGCWMLIAGVGRLQALLIPAVFAAATGWLIFQFLRLRAGIVTAVCAGTVYLSLPVVRHWICAVMVDHMTAFLCLASAACFLRYLQHPGLSNGILCGVISACAILSKYSAVYIVVLPFAAVLVLRRFELLKRPSLLVQPFIVGLIVGPWALWTRSLAFYGLSSEPTAVTAKRGAVFVLETFRIFPPVLMAVVVLGLIALLVRPRAWREDIVVLGILCAGHLALLILSPVDPEQRYMLAPAVVFLVASIAGWWEVPALLSGGRRWAGAIPVFVGILTIVFVVWQFSNFARVSKDRIENVVSSIVKDPARASQRIVVPPNLEGPVIAEFAIQSPRPNYYLLRPSKILAHSDWLGFNYSSVFATSAEMMDYFRQNPVNLIMWNDPSQSTRKAHEQIMSEMLQRYPLLWRKVQLPDSEGGPTASWTIYEYYAQSQETK